MSAIVFAGVSKRFLVRRRPVRSFQDSLVHLFRPDPAETFWALRDVSFAIEPGERVAIIGANGSGKSTTLKLIGRIIRPSEGRVEVRGRVSALLELGTGFHPDLTGRENVFLYGSFLGLGRREMERKLPEIVEFAELEEFVDLPIHHYSSGMLVRLGFAVAINVRPEILLLDEVLAVGDEAFQRKCMERILEFRSSGVTVVLVSHNAAAVRQLCDRAIWLDHGRVAAEGRADAVLEAYHAALHRQRSCAVAGDATGQLVGSPAAAGPSTP